MKDRFDKLYVEEIKREDLFVQCKNNIFPFYKVNLSKNMFDICSEISELKNKHLITHGQDYKERTKSKLYEDPFHGILAETAVHLWLLKNGINKECIVRFDLERPSWEHPSLWNKPEIEYDLKIKVSKAERDIEVKSSTFTNDINYVMNRYHLIGGHINQTSESVKPCEYYFQVFIQTDNKPITFEDYHNNKVIIYLTCGTTLSDLYKNGFVGILSTKNTDILSENDRVRDFILKFKNEINKASSKDEIDRLIKKHEDILFQPLYIQMNIKDADSIDVITNKIQNDYASMLLGKTYLFLSSTIK